MSADREPTTEQQQHQNTETQRRQDARTETAKQPNGHQETGTPQKKENKKSVKKYKKVVDK